MFQRANAPRNLLSQTLCAVCARLRLRAQAHQDEVLTAYLNTVYFGDGAYGAEEAAQRYFGKSARDLDLSESAMLAGLRPFDLRDLGGRYPEAIHERHDSVLLLDAETGISLLLEREEAEDQP